MSLRRSVALTAGVLLLGVPALTSCGFDYPTDRVNTIANGATDREQSVYVLNAVVVASRPGSGTVIATLSNTSNRDAVRLTTVTADKGGALEVTPVSELAEDEAVAMFASASVNLASRPVIRVDGDFVAGQFIRVDFGFDNGEQVTVNAPVVTGCDQYDGLDAAPALASSEGRTPQAEYDCGPPVVGPDVDAEIPQPEGESEQPADDAEEAQ